MRRFGRNNGNGRCLAERNSPREQSIRPVGANTHVYASLKTSMTIKKNFANKNTAGSNGGKRCTAHLKAQKVNQWLAKLT
jgi:hypothetical protein